jgi:hypothetical protein
MNKKRTDAVTDAELEKPFDFLDAHPNPYVGWSRRARASGEEPARGKLAGVSPKIATDPAARKKAP